MLLARDRNQCRTVMNTVMNLELPYKEGKTGGTSQLV
jgi:hypothetical protein